MSGDQMQFDYDDSDMFDPLNNEPSSFFEDDPFTPQPNPPRSPGGFPQSTFGSGAIPQTPSTPGQFTFSSAQSSTFAFPNSNQPSSSSSKQAKKERQPTGTAINYRDIAPPPAPTSVDDNLLQVARLVQSQDKLLGEMGLFQRSFLLAPQSEAFNKLVTEQAKLKQTLAQQLTALDQLRVSRLLSPISMLNLRAVMDKILVQQDQLNLYDRELVAALEQKPNTQFAVLVLEDQPFPNVYKQHSKESAKTKGFEDDRPVRVKLLRSATAPIAELSKVQVDCIFNSQMAQEKVKSILDRTQFDIDITKGGEFGCNFLSGTRKDMARLKFAVALKLHNGQQVVLPQIVSRPFVVISHESQFQESMKMLFITEVFGQNDKATWFAIANELNMFFLKATRQNLATPIRGLSDKDLDFIHRRMLGGGDSIQVQVFANFWDNWFGMVLRELRYKKHMLSMWFMGLIYGFMEKDTITSYLQNFNVGTFLLRFSESKAGSIAVNTVSVQRQKITNYLIKAEETAPTKTHADFLKSKRELTHILQFMNSFDDVGLPVMRAVEKDHILQAYYSREENDDNPYGYDDWDDFSGGPQKQDFIYSFEMDNSY